MVKLSLRPRTTVKRADSVADSSCEFPARIQKGFPTVELRDEHQRSVPNAFARLERLAQVREAYGLTQRRQIIYIDPLSTKPLPPLPPVACDVPR